MFLLKEKKITPKVEIFFETNNYLVKTVSSQKELSQLQQLRYKVFFLEKQKRINFFGKDKDEYDRLYDHIMVIDKNKNKPIATYRVASSLFNKKFYSNEEFEIKNILNLDGNKLELGRAVIDKNYRNGSVFILLWKGILKYAFATNTKYLFGCSSITVKDKYEIKAINEYIKNLDCYDGSLNIRIKKEYDPYIHFPTLTFIKEKYNTHEKKDLIPSLLRFYIKSGAKIISDGAYDKHFKCLDYLTLINLDTCNAKIKNKFVT